MSLLISHRGNINGMIPSMENNPIHIQIALDKGFHVLVDTWFIGNEYIAFGNDFPEYPIEISFLKKNKIICRSQNIDTLDFLMSNNIHCFLSSNDDYIMTNRGLIWSSHGKKTTMRCVLNMPEHIFPDFNNLTVPDKLTCIGICSDHIEDILNLRNSSQEQYDSSSKRDFCHTKTSEDGMSF